MNYIFIKHSMNFSFILTIRNVNVVENQLVAKPDEFYLNYKECKSK